MSSYPYLLPHTVNTISQQRLIVCEGYSDAIFICELLKLNKITNCAVGCPSREGGHGMGQSAIAQYLGAVRGSIDLKKANLTHMLVVTDADNDPEKQFKRIADGLNKHRFTVPTKPFSVEGNAIKTGVFIIPGDGRIGTLENLLWDAAIKERPSLKHCIALLCWCTGGHINNAPPNKKAKMKMSAIVAAHCVGNPWVSASGIWSDSGNPVPIDSTCFSHVSDFLLAFAS